MPATTVFHTISDVTDPTEYNVQVSLEYKGVAIEIPAETLAELYANGKEDCGESICFLEFRNSVPTLVVWANRGDSEPTHVIPFEFPNKHD